MARLYNYRADAALPSPDAILFIEKNAKKHGWGPYDTATDPVWQFKMGPFNVQFTESRPFENTACIQPFGLITTVPIAEDEPDVNLASFVRYLLALFDGMYIEEFRAERVAIDLRRLEADNFGISTK